MQEIIHQLVNKTSSKIVLLVIDGLGGLPNKITNKTELETANIPNLNMLAIKSACGLIEPIGAGITPGSGPAHLALFGYNPLKYNLGRGLLSALGVDFNLTTNDLAVRGNFATIDEQGKIIDRRAGRIKTEENQKLCKVLEEIKIDNIEIFVRTEREHRFVIIFRGDNLFEEVTDSDPQKIGLNPLKILPMRKEAEYTAQLLNNFVMQAKIKLSKFTPANMVLLRGYGKYTKIPSFEESYKLKAAAIAGYPMYRGLAKLVGMEVLKTGETIKEEFETLKENFNNYVNNYDFFYVHIKKTDSFGEDGDFDKKVEIIEETDRLLPMIIELNPDCLIITGDHSTPSICKAHSWHPVPILIYSPYCRLSKIKQFSEKECVYGELGKFSAQTVMSLALAHSNKLNKFGA